MSGHSHFATIKRQKGLKDAQKGNLFGKLSKMISLAIKSGGGPNPEANFKLRVAIEKAKESNMPKDNIDRILKSAEDKMSSLEEIMYEGFGPAGTAVIVEAATDNKNRTAQELKSIFEKAGGSMGGPGSVAYNFDSKGYLFVEKKSDVDSQTLELIDSGADDIEVLDDGIEVYVSPETLSETRKKLIDSGNNVLKMELVMKPKTYVEISDENQINKVTNFLETLEDHDDVQRVFSNF